MLKKISTENKAKLFNINLPLNTSWHFFLINKILNISSLQAKKYMYTYTHDMYTNTHIHHYGALKEKVMVK